MTNLSQAIMKCGCVGSYQGIDNGLLVRSPGNKLDFVSARSNKKAQRITSP